MPLDMTPDRGPINNIEAEQSVLGAVLVNNSVLPRLGSLRPEHFYDPIHEQLFTKIEQTIESGDLASPITLKDWFAAIPSVEGLGGAVYLARLTDHAVTVFDAPANARTVINAHARRAIVAASEAAIESAYAGCEPQDTASTLDASIIGLDFGKPRGRYRFSETMKATTERVAEAYKADGRPIGIMTNLTELDRLVRGFRRGNLVVIAGRPGMGKSALAASLAQRAALSKNPFAGSDDAPKKTGVIIISLEMSDEEYGVRFVSDAMRADGVSIPYSDALDGFSGDAYKANQEQAMMDWVHKARDIESMPISIADMPAQSALGAILSEIRRRAAMLADAGSPVGLIVVDHLGLIALPNSRDNEASRVGYVTAAMKGLAKRMECTVALLSQLNRGVESRDDKRPTLADLRNSGSIEQDADVVLFPFRPEYYIAKDEPSEDHKRADWQADMDQWRNMAEIRVAKNRSGPEGLATVHCDIACNHFSDLARSH